MAKIRANYKNYKNAFRKHVYTYENIQIGSEISKKLLLCYCVECGLKCLIMQNNKITMISQANEELQKVLYSHDFKILLKAVRKAGIYKFQKFQTEYGDSVTSENYHQMCRYCIESKDMEMDNINTFDSNLQEIASWLKEVI